MGHILRLSDAVPAWQAMKIYFEGAPMKKFRGRPRTTLPVVLGQDLMRIGRSLRSMDDLCQLRVEAANRNKWIDMCRAMEEKYREENYRHSA